MDAILRDWAKILLIAVESFIGYTNASFIGHLGLVAILIPIIFGTLLHVSTVENGILKWWLGSTEREI